MRTIAAAAFVTSALVLATAHLDARQRRVQVLGDACTGSAASYASIRADLGSKLQSALESVAAASRPKLTFALRLTAEPRFSFAEFPSSPTDRGNLEQLVARCLDRHEFEHQVRLAIQRRSQLIEVARADIQDVLAELNAASVFGPNGVDPDTASQLRQLDASALVQVSPLITVRSRLTRPNFGFFMQEEVRGVLGADVKVVSVETSQRLDATVTGFSSSMPVYTMLLAVAP